MNDFDSNEFRRVMGAFPTGVVVVTATNETGEALAMTVGSFVSVSLDPPLVGFLPTKTSSSWAALRASGTRFGVNVLGNTQEDVCRAVARRKTDKLDGFDWTPSALGNPRLSDAIAFIDCDTESIFDGGDHDIVIGRVHSLETVKNNLPLLFFRGGYGSFRPGSMAVGAGIPSARLHELDVVRPHRRGPRHGGRGRHHPEDRQEFARGPACALHAPDRRCLRRFRRSGRGADLAGERARGCG
jgi:flavin reductase (DIM6/NTAB) family NADH-FMN oxidoreductase RutF